MLPRTMAFRGKGDQLHSTFHAAVHLPLYIRYSMTATWRDEGIKKQEPFLKQNRHVATGPTASTKNVDADAEIPWLQFYFWWSSAVLELYKVQDNGALQQKDALVFPKGCARGAGRLQPPSGAPAFHWGKIRVCDQSLPSASFCE